MIYEGVFRGILSKVVEEVEIEAVWQKAVLNLFWGKVTKPIKQFLSGDYAVFILPLDYLKFRLSPH